MQNHVNSYETVFKKHINNSNMMLHLVFFVGIGARATVAIATATVV